MDRNGTVAIAKQVFAFLKATALRRFFILLVTLGVGMLTLTWVDLLLYLLPMIPILPKEHPELPVTLVAVSLIAIGIFGFVYEVWNARRLEAKQQAEALIEEEKRDAATLISALRTVIRKFPETAERRDHTYGNLEIMAAITAASTFRDKAYSSFAGNAVMGVVSRGDIDASKQAPFLNVTLDDLEKLATALGAHYEIG